MRLRWRISTYRRPTLVPRRYLAAGPFHHRPGRASRPYCTVTPSAQAHSIVDAQAFAELERHRMNKVGDGDASTIWTYGRRRDRSLHPRRKRIRARGRAGRLED